MFFTDGLVEEAKQFAESEWDKVEGDLSDLVAIDSAKGAADEAAGAPYGPGPRKALDTMLAKARAYGLDAGTEDGHIGYADLPGDGAPANGAGIDGRKQLGIIGHLDTVPAGSGWSSDPHTLTEREGLYVGRGVSDDKGPLTCALHAVRFWVERNKRDGVRFPHDVRLLFGCDEETGMSDADWYLAHHAAPDFLFTPDAEFPVSYGEKGQFQAQISSKPIDGGALVAFEAGEAVNAIPGVATAVVLAKASRLMSTTQVDVEPQPGIFPGGKVPFKVTAHGVAGHAAMPEGAVNALHILADYLLEEGVCTPDENAWLAFVRDATATADGAIFGIQTQDKDFGPLTCVAGMARLVPATGDNTLENAASEELAWMHASKMPLRFTQSIDCRFPTTTSSQKLLDAAKRYADDCDIIEDVTPLSMVEPLLVDPETAPVRALRKAYFLASGVDAAPVTMGGGTYAHHFPVGTSFGAEDLARFPRPDWAGGMHAVDEAVPVAELKQALVAYIVAIGLLMDSDLA